MTASTTKATERPTFPIEEVSLSSRACSGVRSSESPFIELIISPHAVFIPTDVTSIRAYPSAIFEPENKKGFSLVLTATWSLSPVMLDSSTSKECPSKNRPSAGI
ncbi:hypothetical protein SADUNF_Sadunf05G0160000 [Salix dunnii]|uniref:Uncharacterized protein n=1 Tax=Salix dunnii TaxID=1413687 RepID=A0A835K4F8_9ROSI|nr:hypothetical protein SADUNF_Sadunf05G0160000 [Salix dunnii]